MTPTRQSRRSSASFGSARTVIAAPRSAAQAYADHLNSVLNRTVSYPYPLAHVHFNAALADGTAADRLHVPTRRVPLELIVWHLVAEWGVEPKGNNWKAVLQESIAGFDERRRAH
jgi:hypothetical protein